MGSVGSIEKVMVGGILIIILMILAVAIQGNADLPDSLASADGDDTRSTVPNLVGDAPRIDDEDDPRGGSASPRPAHLRTLEPTDPHEREISTIDDDRTNREPIKPRVVPGPKVDPVKPKPTPAKDTPRIYTIKGGDTFEKVAMNELGDRRFVSDLIKANEDVDPRRLRVGQVINLPDASILAAGPSREAVPDDGGTVSSRRVHVVVSGDTLMGISRKYYETTAEWQEIMKANKDLLSSPKDLRPGMELRIP